MDTKISKTTIKGQITLPYAWRKKFNTNNFSIEMYDEKLVIKPIIIEEISSEEIIFDAERDNKGEGIAIDDMIEMLKKVKNG